MRTVLVERVVDVDEQRAQVLGLFEGEVRVDGEQGGQLEEGQEQGLGEALELESVVVMRGGGVGGGLLLLLARGGEVGDAEVLGGDQLRLELWSR